MSKEIVIGTDGSDQAAVALRWAVQEAALHGSRATVLLAWSLLDQYHADPTAPDFEPAYGEADARAALRAHVRATLGSDDVVDLELVCDLPAHALLERSEHADLVVVGARGAGGFEGLLVGSVADRVAERAVGPVVVVRAAAPVREGRVVVGVDGSARSTTALRWAAAEAKARDAELEVVHAWSLPALGNDSWMGAFPNPDDAAKWGDELLAAALRDPALVGLEVTGVLRRGGAGAALLARAEGAGLVVVGSRGHGAIAGWFLGSVSRQLVHHAPCPVVVV
ncbi:MAG: universal stress protein [Acidobacteria bacterium]|nr:universal stress protein [Acidobacteriota bacterium]